MCQTFSQNPAPPHCRSSADWVSISASWRLRFDVKKGSPGWPPCRLSADKSKSFKSTPRPPALEQTRPGPGKINKPLLKDYGCISRRNEKKKKKNTHRLHQHIVLPEQKCCSGVLVQWFHIVPHPHERTIVHATAGLSLLDLSQVENTSDVSHTVVNSGLFAQVFFAV